MKNTVIKALLKILNKLGWTQPEPEVVHIQPKVYVFAANYQHYKQWCRISGYHPGVAVFVDNPQKLFGVTAKDNVFIFYETWRDHPLAPRLEEHYFIAQNR